MHAIANDFRYALRRLRKSPAFTATVIVTLALGIGANSAIFSVVDAVLLRPLPYRAPEQLVTIEHVYLSLEGMEAPVSSTGFRDYRDRTRSFAAMAIETGWSPNLTGQGEPERLSGRRVSADYFRTLGVPMQLGRPLLPEEDAPGRNRVVVLSHGLWQRLFAGDPSAVGRTLSLNGESYEVVGVAPQEFRSFFNRRAELWTPLALPPEQYTNDLARTNEYLNLTARLKEGVTVEQARSEMRAFGERLKQEYPDAYPDKWTLGVTALSEEATGSVRTTLLVLLGAVGFVLLIACANVANLLLARAAARMREVAIRTALGAKRWQLVRQLLAESVLLAMAGGVVGLVLAVWGVQALVAFNPSNVPRIDEVRVDGSVAAFTLAVSLLTGLLFGIVPALQTSRTSLHETLKEGGRGNSGDRARQGMQRVLVVGTFALALALLAGAGLLIKSVARLQGVAPGFDPANVVTFDLALPATRYDSVHKQIALFDEVLPRIAAVPGVRAAGATSVMPFGGGWTTGSFTVEGYTPPPDENPWGDLRTVSPEFFRTLGIPLIRGRLFDDRDRLDAPRVAVIDVEMAQRYWPNQDPIGKRLTFGRNIDSTTQWIEVVGIVGHAAHEGLDADARTQLYLSYRQSRNVGGLSIAVRTAGPPLRAIPAIRQAVHSVDRDLPLAQVRAMEDMIEASVGQRRLSMVLLAVFSAIALALASIGIYGVMSYFVTQRVQEIGVRMALGAQRGRVLGLVLGQGMTLALIGVVIGLAGALALTRLIATQLYAVEPTDPVTLVSVSVLLASIAALATLLPALRATRVDPVVALRQE